MKRLNFWKISLELLMISYALVLLLLYGPDLKAQTIDKLLQRDQKMGQQTVASPELDDSTFTQTKLWI